MWRSTRRNRNKGPRFDVIQGTSTRYISTDGDQAADWTERGNYWDSLLDAAEHSSNGPSRCIIIAGHGVRLSIHQGALLVRSGFTYYPQTAAEYRFFPGHPSTPKRIVLLGCDGYLTFAILEWLARFGISLIALDWQGNLQAVIGLNSRPVDFALARSQRALTDKDNLRIAHSLIERKLRASISTLNALPNSPNIWLALTKLEGELAILRNELPTVDAIRLLEARAAVAYYQAWRHIPMRWKGLRRHPVPAEWLSIGLRQSLLGLSNRNATHPLNAMLNLGFSLLEAQIRIQGNAAGLDLDCGILHTVRPGRGALIFDLMEPLRPEVDRAILNLVRSHVFCRKDFAIHKTGVSRLHPEFARAVSSACIRAIHAEKSVSDYIDILRAASHLKG